MPMAIARLASWAEKTVTTWDDAALNALRVTRWSLIALVALGPASQELTLGPLAERWMHGLAMVALSIQIGLWAGAFLDSWILKTREHALLNDPSTTSALAVLSFLARVALWSVLLLMVLDNLGFDVNTLVAGLGIGGIAIGLALQNILGDLFASLTIVLDKPFQVGHFIIIDEFSGTVEHIGLKATRIRSLSGEMLVFSNADLTKARLRNYKLMQERRIDFKFGVTYDATPEQLEKIPLILKKMLGSMDNVRFDRAHFVAFGDSSLDFEMVYWMLTSDYTAYMDAQQAINLGLMRRLQHEGVSFAFPTRTLVFDTEHAVPVRLMAES
ncbi:MAG: mechanosensitive ion channel family protein [Polaromonas sp.]